MWMFAKTWIQYLQIHYHDPPLPLPTQTLKRPRPHGKNSQKTCFQGMSPDLPPSGGVTLNSFQHMLLSR